MECYGTYDNINDINFDSLPQSFVAKDTLGGGGNSVLIVKDKDKIEKDNFFATLRSWQPGKKTGISSGREWVYENQRKRIILEELLEPEHSDMGVRDYKFFCFDGKVKFIYCITHRKNGVNARFEILDENFSPLGITRNDELPPLAHNEKPKNFKELKRIAEVLAVGFPHVRIDLYNEFCKPRFGEMTFFDGSGYFTLTPDKADLDLGKFFKLPT